MTTRINPALHAAILSTLFVMSTNSGAQPLPASVSVIVDKVNYISQYVMGVDAFFYNSQAAEVSGVTVNHLSNPGSTFASWQLSQIAPSRWWNWAGSGVPMTSGPLEGSLSLTIQNTNGQVSNIGDFQFQPNEEMQIPAWTVSAGAGGYTVHTQAVAGADYYNLWLWDPIDRKYASSQQVGSISDLSSISFAGLVDGRTYNMYLIANNTFTGGNSAIPSTILYRSYDLQYLTYSSVVAVPEPETYAMMLAGLGLMGAAVLRRKAKQA
jgi:hypothetical protein